MDQEGKSRVLRGDARIFRIEYIDGELTQPVLKTGERQPEGRCIARTVKHSAPVKNGLAAQDRRPQRHSQLSDPSEC